MKKVQNVRYGFATNSSSSHSLIYVRDEQERPVSVSADGEFGWNMFVLDNVEDKIEYAMTEGWTDDAIADG